MKTAIRPALATDIPAIASLQRDGFPEDPWDMPAIAQILAMPAAFGRVAEIHGPGGSATSVGFTLGLLLRPECEIVAISVASAFRRRGIGRMLVRDIVELAREGGASEIFLEVAIDNEAARSLYAQLDFLVVGRRRDYYARPGNRRTDALQLRRGGT